MPLSLRALQGWGFPDALLPHSRSPWNLNPHALKITKGGAPNAFLMWLGGASRSGGRKLNQTLKLVLPQTVFLDEHWRVSHNRFIGVAPQQPHEAPTLRLE